MELGVQTVEFIFYLWMIYNLNRIKNITPYRYFDWLITTPIMLITLSAYLDDKNYKNLKEYIYENKEYVIKIVGFITICFFYKKNYLNLVHLFYLQHLYNLLNLYLCLLFLIMTLLHTPFGFFIKPTF